MCCPSKDSNALAPLGKPNRTWVIGSIHADIDKLMECHDDLLERFVAGDRIVYTGNFTGYGFYPRETIDELLTFRRLVMSLPGVSPDDLIYLRGAQEEILAKLFQLPFAPDPERVYMWMLGNGLSSTLDGLEIDRHDGLFAAREGVMGLCRWTGKIRNQLRDIKGYETLMSHVKRAAYTDKDYTAPMLFVNAGVNLQKKLDDQGDSFWWSDNNFNKIHETYDPFKRIVRGFDPEHGGVHINGVTATIDGGCGFGGTLACAAFDRGSELVDLFEV